MPKNKGKAVKNDSESDSQVAICNAFVDGHKVSFTEIGRLVNDFGQGNGVQSHFRQQGFEFPHRKFVFGFAEGNQGAFVMQFGSVGMPFE